MAIGLLIQVLIVIIVIGVIFWAAERLAPSTVVFRTLLTVFEVVVGLIVLIWALRALGIIPASVFPPMR